MSVRGGQPRSARAPRTLPLPLGPDVSEPVPVVVLLFMLEGSVVVVAPEPALVPVPVVVLPPVLVPLALVSVVLPVPAPIAAVPPVLLPPVAEGLPADEPAAPEPCAMATPPRARAAAAVRMERVCFAVFICKCLFAEFQKKKAGASR